MFFRISGLVEMDLFSGHQGRQILLVYIFFLWGYVKEVVYKDPKTPDNMQHKIVNAF